MSSCVPHQFVSVSEGFIAKFTNVSFIVAFMNPKMFGEVLAFSEGLVTYGASVGTVQVTIWRAFWISVVCIITITCCHKDCLRWT